VKLLYRCKLLHAFAKVRYFTAKKIEKRPPLTARSFARRSDSDEQNAGTTNVVQVHRFDHRIGEVVSINKSLNVRRTINDGCQIAYLDAMFFRVKKRFARKFYGTIKFIF